MKGTVTLIILLGWAIFWLGWLLAAVHTKRGRTRWSGYASVRLLLVLALAVAVRGNRHGAAAASLSGPAPKAVGLTLWILGIALAVWARVYIGGNWGTPMSRKENPDLITTGPYRFVRHPIYSGIILAMFGTAVAVTLYWLIPAVLCAVYFSYSAKAEERYMTERFPQAYPAYREKSKMLIPFVF